MEGLLAFLSVNGLLTFVIFLIAVFMVLVGASMLFSHDTDDHPLGLTILIIAALVALLMVSGMTSFVVSAGQTAIVKNVTGTIEGKNFGPGVHGKALIGQEIILFDAQPQKQWCDDFTPAIDMGLEVKLKVCFNFDASKVAWRDQYAKWLLDQGGIYGSWRNSMASLVAQAVSNTTTINLRQDRSGVESKIDQFVSKWWSANVGEDTGLRITLPNWDFTSDQARADYERSTTSALKVEAVTAAKQAAEADRELQVYQVETYSMTVAARADADLQLMFKLGLPSQDWAWYLVNSRLVAQMEKTPPSTIVATIGGGNGGVGVAAPVGFATPISTTYP